MPSSGTLSVAYEAGVVTSLKVSTSDLLGVASLSTGAKSLNSLSICWRRSRTEGLPGGQMLWHWLSKIVDSCQLGSTVLELVQQLEGGGPWPEFLESKGEGLHHIAFTVSNYDEIVTGLQKQGFKMIAGGLYQGNRWSYFATAPGGIVIELGEG